MLNAHNTVNYWHICFNFILMHLLKSGGGKHKLSVFKVFILVPNHHSSKINSELVEGFSCNSYVLRHFWLPFHLFSFKYRPHKI